MARRQSADGHVNLRHRTVLEALVNARVVHPVAQQLAAEFGLEFLELLVDVVGLLLVAHHVFAVALQEVTDSLHADADGTGGLVLVDVLEAEVRRPGVLDNLFDHRIDRRVVAALEAGKFQRDQIGVARHVFGGPDLAAGVFAVAVFPDVADGQGAGALAGYHFGTEETPDDVVVDGQAVLREHRVTELLELFQDFVVDAGIVVIRTAQQHHADAILALQLFQHLAGLAAHGDVVEVLQGAVAGRHGALVLLGAEAEDILEFLVHLAFEEVRLGEVDERVQETYAAFLEHVAFLDERGFDGGRRGGDGGTGSRGLHVRERAGEAIDHREEDDVERFLSVRAIQQIVDVRDAQLAGEAGVDGAALGAFLVHLFAGVIAEDDVLRLDAEGRELAGEDGRLRVHVEHARHTDADIDALLHQFGALLLRGGDLEFGQRVGQARDVRDAEHLLGGDFDKVGVGLFDLVEPALDAAHLFDVLDGALFAGGDDQALRAGIEGDLGLGRALIVQWNQVGLDVDERAQALVLAEIAAGGLFTRGLVLDVGAGVETDEGADAAVVPEASGFERGADGSGFAAMLVHNHVGRRILALEARFDEIHLRFHGGQVVLRAALQQEARADGGEVGNLRNIQPDVLGQDVAEARHDLFRLPALPLEVHNVALHEHGAAVAKTGEALGAESDIGILFHLDVEALRGGLQEVAVARRTLRAQQTVDLGTH